MNRYLIQLHIGGKWYILCSFYSRDRALKFKKKISDLHTRIVCVTPDRNKNEK